MTPDTPDTAELSWRLQAVEASVKEMRSHMDVGFAGLATRIDTLQFVPRGEYSIEHKGLEEKIEGVHRIAMWALGLVVTTVIGAIVTSILAAGFAK